MKNTLLQLFPAEMRGLMHSAAEQYEGLQEIRMRTDREILIYQNGKEWYLDRDGNLTGDESKAVRISRQDLEHQISYSCHSSVYAYADEICGGFLTLPGGHRMGIVGTVVLDEQNQIKAVRNFSGINFRIAHEIKGAADSVIGKLYQNGRFCNTLIIAPPCCGKTTLLRDIVRQVSDGNQAAMGQTVGVVDERSEIAGTFQGMAQNDVGKRTDVLDGCPKELGMMMLIRSMSPGVVAVDELGGEREVEAVKKAQQCGCSILATAHGNSVSEVYQRLKLPFQRYVVMYRKDGEFGICEILDENLKQVGEHKCGK